jgi:hypothetical protein
LAALHKTVEDAVQIGSSSGRVRRGEELMADGRIVNLSDRRGQHH